MTDRPPRVLICARPGTGGAGRVLEAVLRRLPDRGISGTAALSSLEGGRLLDLAADHGWDVVKLDLRRSIHALHDTRAALRLRKIAPGHDLVHAHAAKAGALARLALPLKKGVPVVYSPHGFYFTYHDDGSPEWIRYLGLEQRLAPRTTLLHCVGEAEREIALQHRLATAENAYVLRNPVPPEDADGLPPDVPDDDAPLVVMVARLAPPKDPTTFVRAAAAVDHHEAPRFALVGAGVLEGDARAAAPADRDVRFLPPGTSVRALLRRARVAVLTTDSEALPMFLLEALAEGVPVVATDLPGCRDAAGDAALYVPPRDAVALGVAITRILSDDALHARLAAAARERSRLFTEDAWADGVVRMYERVLHPPEAGRGAAPE